eukprot:1150433-Pelagomonas_calceolata.AAC.4
MPISLLPLDVLWKIVMLLTASFVVEEDHGSSEPMRSQELAAFEGHTVAHKEAQRTAEKQIGEGALLGSES